MTTPFALDEIQEFDDRRRRGLGSTDAAAILGRSPWSSPWDVYAQKVGLAEVREPSLPMYLGLRLQSTVGDLYAHREGRRVRADTRQHTRRGLPWMVAHLDFRVWGAPREIVEAKTAWRTDGWGDDGSDEVPVHYWIQVQHQMAVVGADVVHVAVLFGHRDFRVYHILRDDDFIDKLTAAEDEFWNGHVVPRVPPEIDGTDAARRFLNRRNPHADAIDLPATPEQGEVVDRYRLALVNVDQAEAERDRLRNVLIDIIGPNHGLRGGDFLVTYGNVAEGKPTVAWEAVAAAYRAIIAATNVDHPVRVADEWIDPNPDYQNTTLDAALDTIVSIHTGPGRKAYRRFDFQDKRGVVE
jgi:putative phage-type endonuclease